MSAIGQLQKIATAHPASAARAILVEMEVPEDERDRLAEPYVTTRDKGTGLGLAIVKKIMEDHDGDLTLEDSGAGGARVTLSFADRDAIARSVKAMEAIDRGA